MSRRHRLALLCLGVPALAAAGCGSDGPASDAGSSTPTTSTAAANGTDGRLAVDLTEYRIAAASAVEPAGRVRFAVANDGAIPHELVVLRTERRAADLLTGLRVDETGEVGRLDAQALAAGAKKDLTLDLSAGHYSLVCGLPGHYQGGMYADLIVR